MLLKEGEKTVLSSAIESEQGQGIQRRSNKEINFRSVHANWIRQQSTDRGISLVVCSYWAARHHTTTVGTSYTNSLQLV